MTSRNLFAAGILSILVFLVFSPCLKNQLLNWDDEQFLTRNTLVQHLDGPHLVRIFSSTVLKTYAPLTVFSFALEHRILGMNPFVFHLDNILLHIAVTVLVYALALRLGLSPWAAFLSALLFGIHPMRTEVVAWATERKSLLYSVFYLGCLLNYLRYLRG